MSADPSHTNAMWQICSVFRQLFMHIQHCALTHFYKLLRIEIVVLAARTHEFGVRSALNDPPTINHHNPRGAANGAEPMCNYK